MRSLDTLGDLIDGECQLRVYCEQQGIDGSRCNHSAVIDLVAAAAVLGRDHRSMHEDLKGKFRCTACGSKLVSFRLTATKPSGWTNPYLKSSGGS